ncbi:hypothetical protein C8R44DRAFT_990720, partial [Mycena epipterygia]
AIPLFFHAAPRCVQQFRTHRVHACGARRAFCASIPLHTPSPPPPSRLPGACSFRTVGREPTRGRRRLRRLQRSLCHLSRETQYNARNSGHWTPRCFLAYPPHHPAVAPHPTPSCPSLAHPGRSRPAKPQTPPRTPTGIGYGISVLATDGHVHTSDRPVSRPDSVHVL